MTTKEIKKYWIFIKKIKKTNKKKKTDKITKDNKRRTTK